MNSAAGASTANTRKNAEKMEDSAPFFFRLAQHVGDLQVVLVLTLIQGRELGQQHQQGSSSTNLDR
ncbi:unnamed protein product, partial [Amoebophrya sp. A25]|eukprot:GSA25T00023918001.1